MSHQVPLGWNTLEKSQEARFVKTRQASSAFQKSVRRGKLEAVEDIGLHLIRLKEIDTEMKWGPGHYLALARAVEPLGAEAEL